MSFFLEEEKKTKKKKKKKKKRKKKPYKFAYTAKFFFLRLNTSNRKKEKEKLTRYSRDLYLSFHIFRFPFTFVDYLFIYVVNF